jgi:ABC-type arginine/histidine transport system permease subunit
MPINALTAGVAALAINSTAFTIEIFRGGFEILPSQGIPPRYRRGLAGTYRGTPIERGDSPA